MGDLPGPGLEPVSPASAGRFSTTAPPGKPSRSLSASLWVSGSFPQAGHLLVAGPGCRKSRLTPLQLEEEGVPLLNSSLAVPGTGP